MGKIRSNLKTLLLQEGVKRGRHFSVRAAAKDANLSTGTIQRWADEYPEQTFINTLAALCEMLDCQPGDILQYVPTDVSVGAQVGEGDT